MAEPAGRVGLRPDLLGTEMVWEVSLHSREPADSPEFTVVEKHVSTRAPDAGKRASRVEVMAAAFPDSIGSEYRFDLLQYRGDNSIDISSLPYQIRWGRCCRSGWKICCRFQKPRRDPFTNDVPLHPVYVTSGGGVGAGAFCQTKMLSRQVRNTPALLNDFQNLLVRDGRPAGLPRVTPR
jgi:hypothetical protein